MRLTPSRRFAGLVVLTTLVYLGGTTSLVIWLYTVAAMLCGLLLVGVTGPPLAMRRHEVRSRGLRAAGFTPPLAEDAGLAFEGDRLTIELEGDRLDPDRHAVGPLLCHGGRRLAVSEVHRGAAPGRVEVVVDGCPRGVYRVVGVRVASSWPLGLLTAERTLPLSLDIAVHPRYALLPVVAGSGRGAAGDDPDRRGGAGEIVNLRGYQPQDGRRRIHWLTTARSGELMVVERTPETGEGVACELRVAPGSAPETVEAAVRLIASVAAGCVAERRSVSLRLPGQGAVGPGWAAVRGALAGWSPALATGGVPPGPAAVEVTADAEGLRLRAGGTTVPVDVALPPDRLASVLEGAS